MPLRKVIPLVQMASAPGTGPAADTPANGLLVDRRGRPLHDLRISVTDRCNFRCSYCMPREVFGRDYPFLPHDEVLSFEELARAAAVFIQLGVRKIRLTGGEPLLRRHVERLVEMLASLPVPQGEPLDLTLTTNGSLLARKARDLRNAGLQRVTVSLDAMDDAVFRRMNDADFPVADVLEGIDAALAAGLGPLKINMVVKRGTNDHEILPMVRRFRHMPVILRFIEYMDVGETNGWRMDEVLPSATVLDRIAAEYPLEPLDPTGPGETAERWRYRDGGGEIGVISSVTQAFCRDCSRARLSTDGKLFLCLFAHAGYDLRVLLRDGSRSDVDVAAAIRRIWAQRDDRYSELRGAASISTTATRIEMSYIGG